ncbi:hypothetical protein [Streptomyces phage Psst4]|uniref:Uncharacterized protein n=4 Tax=Rimavirus rima TaxID=2560784 RepID=A0A1I9SDP9_9CAUD|nr:hypothetical protein FDH06_gp22 [Streptomyces phage Rima]AOZ64887.1 hypothetical protein SEA_OLYMPICHELADO_22 [Streptomyces phage OlympicHelado]QAY16320.1 hypothetical protein SEA_NAMO_22 [Streptomyces phage Namo]QWY81421.1 hypothetical protein PET_TAIDAONE_22 [Streptomyces phage TaidaOne]UOW93171.1 hypothetical protein SEA_TONYSTARCH_22 [Streptomyces phage TonyStarch]WPJ30763.1 hypothetical protein [Streptomyces phage Psst4]
MISFVSTRSGKRTEDSLRRLARGDIYRSLESAAQTGVNALASATPVESGLAKDSWGYDIQRSGKSVTITWTNNDVEDGFPVAIMLQYGHGTGTGGYVQGQDYINPAMKPIFDRIADQVWKAVTSA